MDQSLRVNSSGLKKELRLACLLSPREADTESQLQDKSEMWLVEKMMLKKSVAEQEPKRKKITSLHLMELSGYRKAQRVSKYAYLTGLFNLTKVNTHYAPTLCQRLCYMLGIQSQRIILIFKS